MKKQDRNIVMLWCNLSRVYEIAKLGNHSIRVVFDPEYIEGFDDYKAIKKFYSDVKFSSTGDIICEITKPYDYNDSRGETKADIRIRVEQAKLYITPEYIKTDAIKTLMKTAINRLQMSLQDTQQVEAIAMTIAQLANTETVRIEHIAEAIQYRACREDIAITAENKSIQFGRNITIGLTEKNPTDIEQAIEYLQSILKNK
jgi:hypothetical protein